MIYITVPFTEMDAANAWVRENVDPVSGDVFVHNFKDVCLISLPDNGSEYNQRLVTQFGATSIKPDLEPLPESE